LSALDSLPAIRYITLTVVACVMSSVIQEVHAMNPRWSLFTLALMVVLVSSVNTTIAQDEDSTTVVVYSFMKSTSPDYVDLEQNVWAPIHREMHKAGELWGWSLTAAPYSVDGSYDYVTVNVFRGWAAFENAYANIEERFASAHPGKDWAEVSAATDAARKIVRSEVFVVDQWAGTTGDVLTYAHMKVPMGGDADYVKLENEVWKPMHEAAIAEGNLNAWGLLRRVLTGGSASPYDYIALNVYESMEQMMGPGITPEILAAVHPDTEWSEIADMTTAARDGVWYETRFRIAQVP
jgi:hypothetical protein